MGITTMASLLRVVSRAGAYRRMTRFQGVLWNSYATESSDGDAVQLTKTKDTGVEVVNPDELTCVSDFSGIPTEQLKRVARIYVPAKNAMQSGSWKSQQWRLDFETQERWENPLMGWTSSADPLSNISGMLLFDKREEAIAFAVRNGWDYAVEEPQKQKPISKSYGANFSWDKKTKITAK